MKNTHPGTENLFERLFRFTPRQGEKRVRLPLEDYTTEAMAFFLIQSECFRGRFFSDVLKIPLPKGPLQISTQSVDDDVDGRTDLVLISADALPTRIGIEVKLGAEFQPDQLERLQSGFGNAAYLLAPARYNQNHSAYISTTGVKPVALECVERIARLCNQSSKDWISSLLIQFSDFLTIRGFSYLELKMHPMKISSLTESARLLDEWSALIVKLRSELGLERGGQWATPRWEGNSPNWPGTSFYGIHGSNGYAGFSIGSKNDVELYYEESREDVNPSAPTAEGLVRGSDGRIYCTLTEPYPAPGDTLSEQVLMLFKKLQHDVRTSLDQWVSEAAKR